MANKQIITKLAGYVIVGGVTFFLISKVGGGTLNQSVLGSLVSIVAHEHFDAPVSTWIYQNI
jgi:hypothetical protein